MSGAGHTVGERDLIEAREAYLGYMLERVKADGDTLAEGVSEQIRSGEQDHLHGVQIALRAITRAITRARTGEVQPGETT